MATASIFITTSLLLTCVALVLGLLPPCTQARSFQFPTTFNGFISMATDLEKKTPKSPPSPKPAPSKHQATDGEPAKQAPGLVLQLQSTTVFNFGKTPRSPPSPKAAPSKHQGTIEQPSQQSWTTTTHFQFNSMEGDRGKRPRSPPSPKPAPSKAHEMIEQPMQQQTSSQDFQVASF
ncbi:hypothetical protein V6N13_054986 [Hibiscus sabdariffa]|uniref:Uncharacterized protein n=1 Tax=Hibiscus sabdariffa TaxID=183260 RepID=A0ABR2DZJ3_9ROSI